MDEQTALRVAKTMTDTGVGVTFVALSLKQWESLQPDEPECDSDDWVVINAGYPHAAIREIPEHLR